MNRNPVQELFEEGPPLIGTPKEILAALGEYGIRNLAYDGDIGCNPGYIFRGEAAFDSPLQSSLERSLRNKLGESVPIDGETLRAEEMQIITCFVEGPGGRVATIFHPDGKVSRVHPKKDVFWWLSLMQHYNDENNKTPTRLLDFTRDIRLALYFAIEQHQRHLKNHREEKDLIIYCFPCKNLTESDPTNNKCAFELKPGFTDMNLTLGCLMRLLWMKEHEDNGGFQRYLEQKRDDQTWGWDMSRHQNPRLKSQKGMFIYPYDYPGKDSPLTSTGQSWFIQNLARKTTERFNLRNSAGAWPAKRLRIPSAHAEELRAHLDQEYEISKATIYERYAL